MANPTAFKQIRTSHGIVDFVVDCIAFVAAITHRGESVVWCADAGQAGFDHDRHRRSADLVEHCVDVCGCSCGVWAITNHIWARRWGVIAVIDGGHQVI